MRKRVLTFALVLIMAFLMTIPAMAAPVSIDAPAISVEEYVEARGTQHQTFWRNYHGMLQFRIWNLTRGIWVTDWTDFGPM